MKFFRGEEIAFNTPLSEKDIHLLFQKTHPGLETSYEGKITGNHFRFKRFANYRAIFNPMITGCVEQDSNSTIIRIKLRLHPVTMVSSVLLPVGFIFLFVRSLLHSSPSGNIMGGLVFEVAIMCTFIAVPLYGFRFECRRAKADIRKIFKASEEKV